LESEYSPIKLSRRTFLTGSAACLIAARLTHLGQPGQGLLNPQTAKRLYLAADDHTDYLWTADEATYRQIFQDMLDYQLDRVDATINNPIDFQARWNCDGWLRLWTYEKYKPAADF